MFSKLCEFCFFTGIELSEPPQDYRCNENDFDQPQYCLCKGERIVEFVSWHDNGPEDRKWQLGPGLTFPDDEWISITQENGWKETQEWNGVGSNSFLVGFDSVHDNKNEDRTYRFFTARSDKFELIQCTGWTIWNDFDGVVDPQFHSDTEVIAGIRSVFNDGNNDRQFSAITCKLAGKLLLRILPQQNTALLSSVRRRPSVCHRRDISVFHLYNMS